MPLPRALGAMLFASVVAMSCKSDAPTEDFLGSDTSGKANGSAGGFAAALSADLAKGSGAKPAAGGSAGMAGSAGGSGMTAGSSTGSAMAAGSAGGSAAPGSSGAMAMTGGSGGSSTGGTSTGGSAASGSAGSKPGSAAPAAGSSTSVAVVDVPKSNQKDIGPAVNNTGSDPIFTGSKVNPVPVPQTGSSTPPVQPPRPHKPVTPSPELAAIKLRLEPKWERDIDEAATFMRTVDAVSREFTFVFKYGYDDASAPKDRDAYIKWLAEKKLLLPATAGKPLLNRQSGAAWYLEGVDGAGVPTFRFQVNYGDKHLICGGPLYRDTGLGDLRDDVMIQAKSICGSISL